MLVRESSHHAIGRVLWDTQDFIVSELQLYRVATASVEPLVTLVHRECAKGGPHCRIPFPATAGSATAEHLQENSFGKHSGAAKILDDTNAVCASGQADVLRSSRSANTSGT